MVQAKDLSEAWNELSQYRVMSGAKAGVLSVGTYQTVRISWVFAKATAGVFSDGRPLFALDEQALNKWGSLMWNGASVLGFAYAAKLLGEKIPAYAKHALAIK